MEVSIYVMHWFQNMKNKELYKFLILYSKNTCSLMKDTAQKWNFPIKDFFSKYDQICSFLCVWLNLLKKPLKKKQLLK